MSLDFDISTHDALLRRAGLSDEARKRALSVIWTGEEVDEISSASMYRNFQKWRDMIEASAIKRGLVTSLQSSTSEEDKASFLGFMKSSEGVLLLTLDTRIEQWEISERHAR